MKELRIYYLERQSLVFFSEIKEVYNYIRTCCKEELFIVTYHKCYCRLSKPTKFECQLLNFSNFQPG